MGARSRRTCEYLAVLQKPPFKAKETWKDHSIPDVWTEKVTARADHPHKKPVGLQRRLIAAVTKPDDVVVDPCAGSYSVLTACDLEGRIFVGCDILNL